MRTEQQTDRAIRIRQAAMRADAMRSILPLCAVDDAVCTIIERRLIERRNLPRGAAGQFVSRSHGAPVPADTQHETTQP